MKHWYAPVVPAIKDFCVGDLFVDDGKPWLIVEVKENGCTIRYADMTRALPVGDLVHHIAAGDIAYFPAVK